MAASQVKRRRRLLAKPKGLTTGLNDIGSSYELPNELEHICSFVGQCWKERTGNVGTREPLLQPVHVQFVVGLHDGDELLPPVSARFRTGITPVQGAPAQRPAREVTPSIGARHPQKHGGESLEQELLAGQPNGVYYVPDYAVEECPNLGDMVRKVTRGKSPTKRIPDIAVRVRRHNKLFPAIVALVKIRWLVRLHYAMRSLGGHKCGFLRYLKGVLVDSCSPHVLPHNPLPHFDVIMDRLKGRIGQSWPYFLAFVATHGRQSPRPRCAMPASDDIRSAVEPKSCGQSVETLVDDLFVCWLAQLETSDLPVQKVMEELDHFGMKRPVVRHGFPDLHAWVAANPQTKYQFVREAQVEAHHLSLLLDFPSAWTTSQHPYEDLLEMASNVVAFPKTFNRGVRDRVAVALDTVEARDRNGHVVPSFANIVDEGMMSTFNSYLANPRDGGVLSNFQLDLLRDASPPRLVGAHVKFPDVSRWHEKWTKDLRLPAVSLDAMAMSGVPRLEYAARPSPIFSTTRKVWQL